MQILRCAAPWTACAVLQLLLLGQAACSRHESRALVSSTASDARLVAVTPPPGSTDVARLPFISIEFSRQMRASSFASSTLWLEATGNVVPSRVASSGRFASLRPLEELRAGTMHTVVLSERVLDNQGRPLSSSYRFEFRTVEKTPFALVGTNPGNGQRGVAVDSTLEAGFTDTLDADAFDPSWFALADDGETLPAEVRVAGKTLFLRPLGLLEEETRYRASLSPHIRTPEGEVLGERIEFEFVTGQYLDIKSIEPAPGSTEVPRSQVVRVRFSRSIDPGSVDDESFRMEGAEGELLEGHLYANGDSVTLSPFELLDGKKDITVYLAATIRSVSGPPLGNPFSWTFRTERSRVPPMVYALRTRRDEPNTIVGFAVGSDGGLIGEGVVTPTTGMGTSPFWIEGLILSRDQQYLFVSNEGSGDVSSLRVEPDGNITAVPGSPFLAAGTEPTSMAVAVTGPWLFVADDTQRISTFTIQKDGSLALRAQSFSLPGRPFNLKATPDGRWLLVSYVLSPKQVDVLEIDPNGGLRASSELSKEGEWGFAAMALSPRSEFFFAAAWREEGVFVYRTGSWETIAGSPFPNQASDPFDAVVSPDEKFLYIANRNSHNISAFRVNSYGILIDVPGAPFPVDKNPNAISITRQGLIYVGSAGDFKPTISVFRIAPDGALVPHHPPTPLPILGWLSAIALTSPCD